MNRNHVDQISIKYENAEHREYTELFLNYGFSFVVLPTFIVGKVYSHDKKLVQVTLEDGDDDGKGFYDPKILIQKKGPMGNTSDWFVPTYPDHYSELEWKALTAGAPNNIQFTEREIFIWTRVRPNSLNSKVSLNA